MSRNKRNETLRTVCASVYTWRYMLLLLVLLGTGWLILFPIKMQRDEVAAFDSKLIDPTAFSQLEEGLTKSQVDSMFKTSGTTQEVRNFLFTTYVGPAYTISVRYIEDGTGQWVLGYATLRQNHNKATIRRIPDK